MMRIVKSFDYSTMRWLLRLMMVAAVMWVVSCSEDSERDEHREPAVAIELIPGFPAYGEEWPASAAATRADDPVTWSPGTTPAGYYLYSDSRINGLFEKQKDLTNNSIGIFFTKDDGIPEVMQGYFSCQDPLGETPAEQAWRSSVEIKTVGTYQLYGYIPLEEATATISKNPTYADGAVLTLRGLKAVTTSDVCVVVGAKEGVSATQVAYPGIRTGQFDYVAQSTDANNFVYLLFDHIYSAMRFRFTVAERYDEVRTIKLRKVVIKGTEDGLMANYNAVVTLSKRTNGQSPITDISFNSDDYTTPATWEELYSWNEKPIEESGSNEVILKYGELTHLMGRFMPGWSTHYTSNFTLQSTYDVYDKQGNLVRKDCVAENKINLTSLFKTSVIERGHMYSLTLLVEPTYLYMLSEPDLDNPTVKLKKE